MYGSEFDSRHCKVCDIWFPTYEKSKEHKTNFHQRYDSTDSVYRDQYLGERKVIDDYMMCLEHQTKIGVDGCPVIECRQIMWLKKSHFLDQLKRLGGVTYNDKLFRLMEDNIIVLETAVSHEKIVIHVIR